MRLRILPRKWGLLILLLCVPCLSWAQDTSPAPSPSPPQPLALTLATGPVGSLTFPLGGALQRVVSTASADPGPEIVPLLAVTSGSQDSLAALQASRVDLALLRSDVLYAASQTGGEGGANLSVLGAFALEHLTLVVRRDDAIATFQQMADALADGRLRGVGLMGPQARQSLELAWAIHGFDPPPTEGSQAWLDLRWPRDAGALCRQDVGVMVLSLAHPNRSLGRIGALCEVAFVSIAPSMAAALSSRYPYLVPSQIAGDAYGLAGSTSTFSLYVALAVQPDFAEGLAFDLTKLMMEGLPQIQRQHPGLYNLDRDVVAPRTLERLLHPGARRYYQATGQLPVAAPSP